MSKEMDDKLARCLARVAEKSGLGKSDDWTKRDYEQLSILIEQKTKIVLSVSTLLRLFKSPSSHKPQKITLDALAKFAGYNTWHEFCTNEGREEQPNLIPAPFKRKWLPVRWVYLAGITALIIIAYFGFHAVLSNGHIRNSDVWFKVRNRDITGIPATIQIDYKIGKQKPDSVWIQMNQNPNERIPVDPALDRMSAIYFYPGVHDCKLVADSRIIGVEKVLIKTSGWATMIRHDELQPIPLYIRNSDVIHDGVLQVTEAMVNIQNLEPNSRILTSYSYVNDLGPVYGNDYTLSANIHNPPTTLGTQPCLYCTVYILGENGKHFFTIGDLGCSAFFSMGFSGSDDIKGYPDLTDFEYVSDGWRKFRTIVSGNKVDLYIEKSKIFSSDKVFNIGKIKGVVFDFSGLGAIDRVKLTNSKDYVAMDETFD
jgi:hypothetical protein